MRWAKAQNFKIKQAVKNKKIDEDTKKKAQEHLGVGILVSKKLISAVSNVTPVSARIITCTVRGSPNWHIIVAYAPQAFIDERIKDAFYHTE